MWRNLTKDTILFSILCKTCWKSRILNSMWEITSEPIEASNSMYISIQSASLEFCCICIKTGGCQWVSGMCVATGAKTSKYRSF